MVSLASRARLLGGATLGLGLTMVAASSAQAACNVSGTSVLCVSNTTTTDTSYPVNVPSDRNYDFNLTPVNLDVDAGVLVDGFGLSFTDNTAGAATGLVTFVNDGTVQVNALNTASAGGLDGALGFTGINSSLSYTGVGDIINLGTGDGFEALITGTGGITAVIGGSVRADTGDAIAMDSTNVAGGAISVTTTAGETVRASQGDGIEIDTAGSGAVAVVNNAAISSGGDGVNTLQDGINVNSTGTGSLSVTGNGAIGTAADRAQLTGINASIGNAASAGNVTITTGTGGIWSVGTGVEGSTLGTGNVAVTIGTGGVNSTLGIRGVAAVATTGTATIVTNGAVTTGGVGAAGLYADTTTGAISITNNAAVTAAGAGSAGIAAYSTTGPISITVNGNVVGDYGIFSNSGGTRTITVTAGDLVDGNTQAAIHLLGTGTGTISNSGTIGGVVTDLAVNAAGSGATTLTNNASGVVNGRLTLSANADTFTNGGTWNTQGTTDFGAGADTLNNQAAGIINLTANSSLVGLETYTQAGRLNLATFVLTGPAITLTNTATGTITTTGSAGLAGFTALTNAGTITLGAGTFTAPTGTFTNSGTVNAKLGATTITGQTSFVNAGGLISLQDGATNDVLTINSNFAASGNSRLALDIDNTTADRLIINGNVTGTSTNVLLTPLAGTAGIDTSGILIVDVSGTSAANAFTTTSVMNTVINYSIEKRGNDFFVVALPNAAAFSPVLVGNMVLDTWYQGAEAFNAMAAARGGESDGGIGLWLQAYYGRERYGSSTRTFTTTGGTFTIPTRMRTKRHGIQGGVDFNAGIAAVGLTGGYQHAEIGNGSPSTEGWNIGAYAMAGGTAGMYGNVLVKYDNDKQDLDFGAFSQSGTRTESTSLGADGEVGFRFPGSGSVGFDASAGLAYVNAKIDTFSFGGIDYDYDTVNSLRGRIGGRAVFYNLAKMFVGGKLMHEFNGDTDLLLDSITDASVSNRGRGTWGRLEGGFGGGLDTPFMLMGWGDFGDVKGWGVRGGVRMSFGGARVAEMAPPPPPPPPPPAYEPAPVVEEPAPPPPPPPPPAAGERG